jgi:hypothetical protein
MPASDESPHHYVRKLFKAISTCIHIKADCKRHVTISADLPHLRDVVARELIADADEDLVA